MAIFYTDSGSFNSLQVTGSLTVTGKVSASSFTGSFQGTSSYATQALSSSFATTASYLLGTITSASYALTASYVLNAISASYVATASYVTLAQTASYVTLAQTASYVENAQTASYVLNAVSASQSTTASYALTASYIANASSFPFTGSAIITGSLVVTGSITTTSGVYAQAITASSISASSGITGSLLGTASFVTGSIFTNSNIAASSSYSTFALTAGNGGVTKIIAGPNVGISPLDGLGDVTVTAFGNNSYNTATGSYGSFYDTGSVIATSATTIYSMSLSTTDISNGVFVSASNGDRTRVKFTNAGTYNIQFSAQFSNSDNSTQDVIVWIRKNGTDIPDSAGTVGVPPFKAGSNGQSVSGWNYYLSLTSDDFIQLCWNVEEANVITLETIAAGTSPTHPRTPSLILTATRVDTFLSNTGSFSGSFTGTFNGTIASASYATTASYVNGSIFTSSNPALSASFAQTASYVTLAQTASYVTTAQTASYVLNTVSASFASTASYITTAQTASYVLNAQTASYVTLAQTASYVTTAQTASYVLSSSYAISSSNASTASYVLNAVSSSYATTASYLNTLNQDLTFNGNLTLNGTASIAYLNVAYESSSIIYSSGSNQFGDATNDTQTLIGRVIVSGSLEVTGSVNTPSITGSLLGTASYASQALTASYVQTAQTASYVLQAVSASFATTASYASQALLSTNVVGSANRILFNNGTNTTTTSNELTWTDGTNLLTLGSVAGTAGTISKLALYTSSFGGYGFGVSPSQLDYVTDGSHVFYKNGVTPTELVRITSTGNVGIGTTSPITKLDVASGVNTFRNSAQAFIGLNTDFSNGDYPGIWFNQNTIRTVTNYAFLADGVNTIFNAPTTGTLNFRINNSNKIRVFETGNIVIQNGGLATDAGFRLDVQGTSRFNGNSTITGSLTATSISSSAFNPTNIINNYFPVKSGSALVDSMLYQSVAGETLNWGSNTTPNARTFAIRAANYPQVALYNAANSYSFSLGPAGSFSFTNGANNNVVIALAQNASASISIVDQNISTCFNGGNFSIGHNNIYTIPSRFYVVGNSIMTGSLTVSGSVMVTGGITGSLLGTATTASYVLNAVSSSFATTASYYGGTVTTAATASYSTNFTVANTLIIDQTLTDYARVTSTIVGANNLFTQATGSYRSAFGKYTLFNGTNARSGEFIAVLNDTNVRYTDSSTTDIGDTTDIVFSAAIVGSDLQINADAASSGWTVRMLTTYL